MTQRIFAPLFRLCQRKLSSTAKFEAFAAGLHSWPHAWQPFSRTLHPFAMLRFFGRCKQLKRAVFDLPYTDSFKLALALCSIKFAYSFLSSCSTKTCFDSETDSSGVIALEAAM